MTPSWRTEVERLLTDDERASRDHFVTDPSPRGQGDEGHRPGLVGLRGVEIHILCPHCRNAIELVGPTGAAVLCPACGSSFRLERESTASWGLRGEHRRLGRFELIEAVGVGAFGTVYKARDGLLDRVVAIKVPAPATWPRMRIGIASCARRECRAVEPRGDRAGARGWRA